MAYKTSSTTVIDSADSVIFKEMIVGVNHTILTSMAQSTDFGYAVGGYPPTPTPKSSGEKFPFATTTTNASAISDLLTVSRYYGAGSRSFTHCYTAGGEIIPGTSYDVIDKFPLSADAIATDVGDLTQARFASGNTNLSGGFGYASGQTSGFPTVGNTIDKYSHSTDQNATDVGDLTQSRGYSSGQSSTTHGYVSGGTTGSGSNVIDKFPFSTDENASDVGDITVARWGLEGASSTSHGYVTGGYDGGWYNIIEKFPFSSDDNAADVGDMTVSKSSRAGISSMTHGYSAGGSPGVNSIE